MGMSASQARLLSITARLSDVEFGTQQISNSKMRLAAQSEEVTSKYSNSLNQKQIQLQTGFSNGSAVYTDLSYDALTGVNSPLTAQYGLSDSRGRLLVTQDMKNKFESAGSLENFLSAFAAETGYLGGDNASYLSAKATYDAKNTAYANALKTKDAAQIQYDAYTADTNAKFASYTQAKTVKNAKQSAVNSFESSHIRQTGNGHNLALTGTWSVNELFEGLSSSQFGLNDYSDSTLLSGGYNPQLLSDLDDIVDIILNAGTYDHAGQKFVIIDDSKKYDQNYFSTFEQANNIKNVIAGYVSDSDNYQINAQIVANQAAILKSCINNDRLTSFNDASFVPGLNGITAVPVFDRTTLSPSEEAQYAALLAERDAADQAELQAFSAYKTANDLQTNYANNTFNPANAAVTTTYNELQAAKAALAAISVVVPAEASYYTNIYNRMQQGYVAMSDEKNTINNSEWLANQLQNGKLILEKVTGSTNKDGEEVGKWAQTSWKSDTNFVQSYDDTRTAVVKAEYDSAMAKINNKDKKFDLELKALDTEHNALQTEYDSVKKVIEKNIERSYKTFNG